MKYCVQAHRHVQAHRQNWSSLFDQTRPRQLRFISFGFCAFIYLLMNNSFIYLLMNNLFRLFCFCRAGTIHPCTTRKRSLRSLKVSFARGPNEARTMGKKRWKVILDLLYLLRAIVMSILCAEPETSFQPYMVVPRSSWIIFHGHCFDSSIPCFDK